MNLNDPSKEDLEAVGIKPNIETEQPFQQIKVKLSAEKNPWEELDQEFKKEFSITVTPNSENDATNAFLLEKFWEKDMLSKMANWWIYKIDVLLASEREKVVGEVLQIIDEIDPSTNRNTSAYYWGNILRRDIRTLTEKDKK